MAVTGPSFEYTMHSLKMRNKVILPFECFRTVGTVIGRGASPALLLPMSAEGIYSLELFPTCLTGKVGPALRTLDIRGTLCTF